jgi:hypothetical protein
MSFNTSTLLFKEHLFQYISGAFTQIYFSILQSFFNALPSSVQWQFVLYYMIILAFIWYVRMIKNVVVFFVFLFFVFLLLLKIKHPQTVDHK